jgi:hypothetical protein
MSFESPQLLHGGDSLEEAPTATEEADASGVNLTVAVEGHHPFGVRAQQPDRDGVGIVV